MIARLIRGTLAAEDIQSTLPRLRETVSRLPGRQAGCSDAVVLANRETSSAAIIALWDDAASAREYSASELHGLLTTDDDTLYSVDVVAGEISGNAGRILEGPVTGEGVEAVVSRFQNVVMHAATSQQGFRGALLLVSLDRDRAAKIGFWDTASDLRQSEQTDYFQQQIPLLYEVFDGPPLNLHYDTIVRG